MADAPPKKKLPFKQRKKPAAPASTPGDDKAQDVDELDLFSRRKEMQPILEADRKRRLEKEKRKAEAQQRERAREKKEQEELQRGISAKRPLEDDEEFFDAKERQSIGGPADEDVIATDESMEVKGDSLRSVLLHLTVIGRAKILQQAHDTSSVQALANRVRLSLIAASSNTAKPKARVAFAKTRTKIEVNGVYTQQGAEHIRPKQPGCDLPRF